MKKLCCDQHENGLLRLGSVSSCTHSFTGSTSRAFAVSLCTSVFFVPSAFHAYAFQFFLPPKHLSLCPFCCHACFQICTEDRLTTASVKGTHVLK